MVPVAEADPAADHQVLDGPYTCAQVGEFHRTGLSLQPVTHAIPRFVVHQRESDRMVDDARVFGKKLTK